MKHHIIQHTTAYMCLKNTATYLITHTEFIVLIELRFYVQPDTK